MARRRRNKRNPRARQTGNAKAPRGRAVKVRRRSNKACTTINQKAIE